MTEYRKLMTSDILPLIYDYLKKINLKNFASKLQKMSGMDLENSESPLAGKSLKKIIKTFIKHKPSILSQFEVQEEEEEDEEEQEENESEQEEVVVKKQKTKTQEQKTQKRKRSQSINSIHSETSQPKSILKKNKVENNYGNDTQQPSTMRFFQRCDESRMNQIKQELKDNTFLAKSKFGQGGDAYGEEGWNRLKDKRGKEFKKEKGKLKNKAFCGGNSTINPNVINSIKL